MNKLNDRLVVLKTHVDALQKDVDRNARGEKELFQGLSDLYDERFKSLDVVIDIFKNLLTVVATMFVATFAIKVEAYARMTFGIMVVLVLVALYVALSHRWSMAVKKEETLKRRLLMRTKMLRKNALATRLKSNILLNELNVLSEGKWGRKGSLTKVE